MPDPLPLYVNVDGVYQANALSQPWGDVISEGVVFGGAPAGVDPLVVGPIAPAGMGVQIGPGVCWITNGAANDSDAYYQGGAWRAVFLAAQQLPVTAAHATLARIDRVVAEVLDAQFGNPGDVARLRVIAGTAAASPAAPAEPRNALTLATVSVPAAATAITAGNITDARAKAYTGGRAVREIALARFVAPVSVTGTAAAEIVTSGPITYDGSPIRIEFQAFVINVGSAGIFELKLYDGPTDLGTMMNGAASEVLRAPNPSALIDAPTPGSHTYRIMGKNAASQTTTVSAGAGGAGVQMPGYIRIAKR